MDANKLKELKKLEKLGVIKPSLCTADEIKEFGTLKDEELPEDVYRS